MAQNTVEWHSVATLPDTDRDVLVYTDLREREVAEFQGGLFYSPCIFGNITHWAELPQPPTE